MNRPLLRLLAASLLSLVAAGPPAREGRAQDCGLPVQSSKFDEYGDLPAEEERARLKKLAAALDAKRDDTKAFIIGYAGRGGRAGDGIARADRARRTLTESSFDSFLYNMRVNTLDCGRREAASTELWITPAGAAPPRCSPTLDPTPAPAKGGTVRRPPRRRSGRL